MCASDDGPALLPPGDYDAVLFQASHIVPSPRPVAVHVVSANRGT
jgi:hypothetical protein